MGDVNINKYTLKIDISECVLTFLGWSLKIIIAEYLKGCIQ